MMRTPLMMIDRYKFLLDVGRHRVGTISESVIYHVFPDEDAVQEEHFKPFNKIMSQRPYSVKRIPQKDGSKFYGLWTLKSIYDVAHHLRDVGEMSVYVPIEMEPENLLSLIGDSLLGDIENGDAQYIVYWTHTFLNGKRMLPVIVHHQSKSVFNLTVLFKGLITEDGFGVLVDEGDSLELSSIVTGSRGSVSNVLGANEVLPEIRRYFSMIRMCPCCGVISNHGKA
ncbi:MAG: hypothetical protein E4H07_08650, partial [Nitrosomonadales bacterium]